VTDFYDSARWGLIPKGADAAVYFDGRYAVTPEEATRFSRTRWITVLGGAPAAAHAGACDYEPGNASFEIAGRLREWAAERKEMGCLARVYAGRSNLAAALDAVGDLENVIYWVATLDGKPWTAAELTADLLALDIAIAENRLWAVQYKGGPTAPYDESILLNGSF
jgi:hypothetical protein